jgi:hypothetical protein
MFPSIGLGMPRERKKIEFPKSIIYKLGSKKVERQTQKKMARLSEGEWKTSWWKKVEGKVI